MESTLEEVLDSIENDDPEELQRLLGNFSREKISEYFEIEDSVLMTPLLYAVKYRSPDCVDVLVTYGADHTLSLKIQDDETDTDRSLSTNALQYATGEKNKASSAEDKVLYEDIIAILNECQVKHSFSQNSGEAPANSMTPFQLADVHRITQKTIQNQIAVKKLTEENENLKKELNLLKQEIERFRPWIEKWIYQTSPNSLPLTPLQQPLVTVEETDETPSKKEKKKTYIYSV